MTEDTVDTRTPSQIQNDQMEKDNLFFYEDYSSQEDADFKNVCLEARGEGYKYSYGTVYDKDGVTILPGVRFYKEGACKRQK
ncbi:MAG: hypothetical protein WCP93_04490 [Candidatus Berkelbacteria bacterium]